jgi:hypothetical protein
VLQRGEQRARDVCVVNGGNGSRAPCLKGRGTFIDHSGVPNCGSVTLQSWLSYMTNGARSLRMSIHRDWIGLLGHSSWLLGAEVEGAWDGSWCYRVWRCFTCVTPTFCVIKFCRARSALG